VYKSDNELTSEADKYSRDAPTVLNTLLDLRVCSGTQTQSTYCIMLSQRGKKDTSQLVHTASLHVALERSACGRDANTASLQGVLATENRRWHATAQQPRSRMLGTTSVPPIMPSTPMSQRKDCHDVSADTSLTWVSLRSSVCSDLQDASTDTSLT
jgi:hypothetical protein